MKRKIGFKKKKFDFASLYEKVTFYRLLSLEMVSIKNMFVIFFLFSWVNLKKKEEGDFFYYKKSGVKLKFVICNCE